MGRFFSLEALTQDCAGRGTPSYCDEYRFISWAINFIAFANLFRNSQVVCLGNHTYPLPIPYVTLILWITEELFGNPYVPQTAAAEPRSAIYQLWDFRGLANWHVEV